MFLFRQKALPYTDIRSSLRNIYGIGWLKSIVITSKMGYLILFS